jgi:hypothetical protein
MIILNIGIFPIPCGTTDNALVIVQEENLHCHQISTRCTVGGCDIACGAVFEAWRTAESCVDFILAVRTFSITAVRAQGQVVESRSDFSTIVALKSRRPKTCRAGCMARLAFIHCDVPPKSVWAFQQAFIVVIKVRLS